MSYVNQGCPGQLPLTVHIQLFQPAYSSDKESVWKRLPLGSSPQLYVFRCTQDGRVAFFFFLTLLSNFFTAGTRSLQPWCGDVYKDHQPLGERKHSSMRERH